MTYDEATIRWGHRHLPGMVTDGSRCADSMHFRSGAYVWDGGPIGFSVSHSPYRQWSEDTIEDDRTDIRAEFTCTNGKMSSVRISSMAGGDDDEYLTQSFDLGALIRELTYE